MSVYQVGETIRLNASITNDSETSVDPSTVKIKIKNPDGTEAVASSDMVNPAVGSYYYDYLISDNTGTYNWSVTATGSEGRITIVKDMFSVNSAI